MPGAVTSQAANDLGAGLGNDLSQQVKDETEEQRRKRLLSQQTPMTAGVMSLLGPSMGLASGSA